MLAIIRAKHTGSFPAIADQQGNSRLTGREDGWSRVGMVGRTADNLLCLQAPAEVMADIAEGMYEGLSLLEIVEWTPEEAEVLDPAGCAGVRLADLLACGVTLDEYRRAGGLKL